MIENYLSPYIETIYAPYFKKEYRRYDLTQSPGKGMCHSMVWYDRFTHNYKITWNYELSWEEDRVDKAKKYLDDYLINQGYILCSSMEQFEKLRILI